MHPLDHLEDFTDDWISHLQESDPISPEYKGPRCPFAKKRRKMKTVSSLERYMTISLHMTSGKLYQRSVISLMAVMM